MADRSEFTGSLEEDTESLPVSGVSNQASELQGGHAQETEVLRRPRKKVPIINRRGPSEMDRFIHLNQARNGQGRGAARTSEGTVSRGTVLRLDKVKGFGFLVDQAGDHRFFHCSAVLDDGFASLKEQDAVEFEPYSDERGARAIKVRPAGTPMPPAKAVKEPKPSPKTTKPAWRSDLSPFRNGTRSSTKKWKI